jgi:polyhydroxyalkanoate synthesis regulator phasin
MTDVDKPEHGLWAMSIKEMSALCRCVDGKILKFLTMGPSLQAKHLASKLTVDYCDCLVETGICNTDVAQEVLDQIVHDAEESRAERRKNAATQLYEGREVKGRKEPAERSKSISRSEGLRGDDGEIRAYGTQVAPPRTGNEEG